MNLGAVTYPVACHDKGSDKAASGGRLHYNDSVVYQCGYIFTYYGGTKCIVQACHSQLVRNRKSGKSDSLNYYIMCVMRMINEL